MASSGKKGKKSKGKTLALNDFLQETPGPAPTIPIRKTALNWADEVEDVYADNYDTRPKTNVVLPTAPKAARGLDDYSDKIPQNPPYIAYLSNLPYDVDEEEIAEFFGNLKISSMRIPKDDRPGEGAKLKGYGYVEFEDRDSLLGALAIPDCTLKNRRIRIEVATNSENDRRRGGRMDVGRDRGDRQETSMGDWRSGPRTDPEPERRPVGSFNRDREREGSSFNRDREREGSSFNRDREREGSSFNRDRERESSTASERDRPGAWRDSNDRPSFRDDKDKFKKDERSRFDRDNDRRGFDRDGDRRGFDRDSDRRFDRDERRGFGSKKDDRNGGFSRGGREEDKPEPTQRRKLNLMPRTKPIEELPIPTSERETESARIATSSVPAASIFGNAKPVDTSARDRQIEERLAKEHMQPPEALKDERRKGDDRKRIDDNSPRRGSPERRKYSPKRGSIDRKRDDSLEKVRASPDQRRDSTDERRGSSDQRKGSSDRRRGSSDRRQSSSDRNRNSPDQWRSSPERRRSPEIKKSPPSRRRNSPYQRRKSPDHRIVSPEQKRGSPDHRKGSSDRNKADQEKGRGPPRKNEDRDKKAFKSEKPPNREKDKPRREYSEREMPKLKEPEAPNFVGSNKYAFLADESD